MKKKTTVLSCPVDLLDENEALKLSKESIEEKRNFHIITINPEMIMNAQNNSSFFNILNSAVLTFYSKKLII